MKLDYNFIKEILKTMEEHNEYCISSHELMKKLNISSNEEKDKFIGHILILGDNNIINCNEEKYKFGLIYFVNGNYDISDVKYRITAQGYEFFDILKKDNIFYQLTDLALPTAIKIGTQLLIQTIWEKIKNGT